MKKRKKQNRFAALAAGIFLMTGALSSDAQAYGGYTYTITFYAGNQGRFSGIEGLSVSSKGKTEIKNDGSRITVTGLREGDIVSFDVQNNVVSGMDPGKYYVKGLRLAGRDNEQAGVEASAFRVAGDEDYVTAYGIRGNMTRYTVRYQDEDGNRLAPDRVYYGNVGDKPVAAYLYMENYTPQALALTKTLSDNEAENLFTFIYTPAEPEVITEPGETVTVTTVVPGTDTVQTVVVPGAAAGITGEGTGAEPGGAGRGDMGAGTQGTAQAGGEGEIQVNENETPLADGDIVDLDENETPRAKDADLPEQEGDKDTGKRIPLIAGIAIGTAALIAIGALFLVVRKHLK